MMHRLARHCAVLLLAVTAGVQAQSFPERPLRMIVPLAPSGSTDLVARVVSDKLGVALGQPVVVENLPGAIGAIGLQALAKATPDGHTLGLGTIGTIAINPVVRTGLAWDPVKDFTPVGMIGATPFGLLVKSSLPVRSVAELVELARRQPGQLTYATGGAGGSQHVAMEMLMQMNGIRMLHVPYKGSGPALVDLIGGHVDVMIEPLVSATAHVNAGKVRLLALTGGQRSPAFPDVPLVSDTLPGYDVSAWFALYAPAGTPAPAVDRLGSALTDVLGRPDVQEVLSRAGFTITPSTPAELAAFHGEEVAKWRRVVSQAGLVLE